MSTIRALNLAQHWLTEGADEETHQRVRAMMTGPLSTTIPPQLTSTDGRRRPAVPWWWGSDEDASASAMAAMRTMRR